MVSLILDAVIDVVCRYGIKRATMDELARGSGVSRQTLYDRYGNKDGVIAAAITMAKSRTEEALRAELAPLKALDDKIETYFAVAVWPVYERMRSMPDAADLERGLGQKSRAASTEAAHNRRGILAGMLSEHALRPGQTPQDIAVFFDQSCGRAKNVFRNPGRACVLSCSLEGFDDCAD